VGTPTKDGKVENDTLAYIAHISRCWGYHLTRK
jgi:hypothetical protein